MGRVQNVKIVDTTFSFDKPFSVDETNAIGRFSENTPTFAVEPSEVKGVSQPIISQANTYLYVTKPTHETDTDTDTAQSEKESSSSVEPISPDVTLEDASVLTQLKYVDALTGFPIKRIPLSNVVSDTKAYEKAHENLPKGWRFSQGKNETPTYCAELKQSLSQSVQTALLKEVEDILPDQLDREFYSEQGEVIETIDASIEDANAREALFQYVNKMRARAKLPFMVKDSSYEKELEKDFEFSEVGFGFSLPARAFVDNAIRLIVDASENLKSMYFQYALSPFLVDADVSVRIKAMQKKQGTGEGFDTLTIRFYVAQVIFKWRFAPPTSRTTQDSGKIDRQEAVHVAV